MQAEDKAHRYDDDHEEEEEEAEEADEEDEEDECRVCRGPAEEGRPLFKPCICSGSIGLTHQDCLQSWLHVQRGDGSCELCKTKFRFAPKYDVNAPAHLPLHEVIAGLCRRAVAKWLPFTIRSLFAASLWLLLAPLLTAYLYHGWMARPTVILARMSSWNIIVTDLISGGVVAACIIVSFLSLMSFADFLRVEWQQRGGLVGGPLHVQQHHQQRNNDNRDVHPAAAAAVEDFDIDNGVWDRVQQQVLQQPANRAHNPRLHQLAARERGMNERGDVLDKEDDEEDDNEDEDNDEFDSNDDYSDDEHEDYASSEQSNEELDVGVDGDDDDSDDDESWQSEDDGDGDDDDDEDSSSTDDENDHSDPDDADVDIRLIRRRGMDPDGRGGRGGRVVINADDERAAELADADARLNRQNDPQQQLPAPRPWQIQRNDARIDLPFDMMDQQDEPVDMDINIALDELLGVRGPLLVVGRNLLWLLAFNAVYLGFFAFVPRTIGMAMSSILFNTTAFATTPAAAAGSNATEAVPHFNLSEDLSLVNVWKAIEAESVQHNTAFRLHDVATVALGYLSLAVAVVFFRFLWFLSQKVRFLRSAHTRRGIHPNADEMRDAFDEMNRLVHGLGNDDPQFGDEPHGVAISIALGVALDAMLAIVKVGVLLFLKMFLLPIVLGIALDASTISVLGSTLEERIAYAGRDIFSFILLHWVAGITFMLLVTVSVLQLREVAHPDLLAQMIRPQEPQPDLLGNLMHESVSTHSKRMVLSLIIYAFLLTVHVYAPVRFGISRLIGDRFKAHLQLKFFYILTPQLQVPLELLFFHLCMLALLEKYKNGLGGMQHHWLKFMTKIMGLSDRILPQKVGNFRLLGSRPVFQRGRKVDPFWYDITSGHKDVLAVLQSNLGSFEPPAVNALSAGEAKSNGERVLRRGADYIRLPIRLPGKALRSRSILLPTKFGKYRLKRDTSFNNMSPVIQLWEEVPGEPISRPPEGWDDLGAGGADVQGRWAWGSEKKSFIEEGVAARRPFFDKDQGFMESFIVCLKVLVLCILSWLASSIILCIVAVTPLAIGRSLYYILQIPDRWIHDPLAFGLGFMIIFPIVRKTARTVMSSETPLHQRLQQWMGRFHAPPAYKALVLLNTAILWFGLAPLLLGLSYDLAFIKSSDWFAGKEPLLDRNTSLLSWMGGTVLLYLWTDLCILGVLTRNYRVFLFEGRDVAANENGDAADLQDGGGDGRHLTWQGKHGRMARFWGAWKSIVRGWEWDQVDEVLLLHDCAAPIVVELLRILLFPVAVLGICFWRFPLQSGLTRAIFVRSVLALTCCIQIGRVWKDQLGSFVHAAHKTARDDRYLIGEILMNYGELP